MALGGHADNLNNAHDFCFTKSGNSNDAQARRFKLPPIMHPPASAGKDPFDHERLLANAPICEWQAVVEKSAVPSMVHKLTYVRPDHRADHIGVARPGCFAIDAAMWRHPRR